MSTKSELIRKGDALFAAWFHGYYKVCSICGHYEIEMAHLISRGNHLFRFDKRNVIPLCAFHHRGSRLLSAHGSPEAFKNWMEENRPEQYEFWQANKNKIGVSIPEYWYREQIKAMKLW